MVSFRLALATAVRMVNRVHRDAAHVTALAEPSRASRLADRNILMVEVADLADSGAALRLHHPLLKHRRFAQVTHDKFYLVIETSDPKYAGAASRKLLEEAGSKVIELVEE